LDGYARMPDASQLVLSERHSERLTFLGNRKAEWVSEPGSRRSLSIPRVTGSTPAAPTNFLQCLCGLALVTGVGGNLVLSAGVWSLSTGLAWCNTSKVFAPRRVSCRFLLYRLMYSIIIWPRGWFQWPMYLVSQPGCLPKPPSCGGC
jgi:hypothetical protein